MNTDNTRTSRAMRYMLEGVAMNPELNQPDGIHPTPKGYEILTAGLLPYVQKALELHHSNPTGS